MTLSIFQFQAEQSVRVEFQNNEPLFCLTDVARILEISNANPLRFNMKRDGVHKMYSVDTKGRKNEITYINEPNLYRVIFRSRKAEAVKFQDWIFEEVIPQIRKTGGYQIGQKTTADDRTGLRQAVAALVGRKGIDYSSAYSMIHQRFNVEAIEDIPAEKLPEAVAYVHALTLHTGLTGEVLDREPLSAPQPALPIDGNALYDLAVAVRYGAWAIQMGRDVSVPLFANAKRARIAQLSACAADISVIRNTRPLSRPFSIVICRVFRAISDFLRFHHDAERVGYGFQRFLGGCAARDFH